MEEKKVQNTKAVAESKKADKLELKNIDGYFIIPDLYISREPYQTKKGVELWSYGVDVEFYGTKKTVGLQTPNDTDAGWNQEKRDKYGYQVLDAMFEALGKVPLAIKISQNAAGDLRSIEYFAAGIDEFGGAFHVTTHIQLVTQKSSSESLLRSVLNRMSLINGWDLPVL